MTHAFPFRVGLGHDTHRLIEGDFIVLGGVRVPSDRGFLAHSDGDVLLHAIIDAILGAVGHGDIGELFPDSDPVHCGRDSSEMLAEVMQLISSDGWLLVNLDAIIFAQLPRLTPWKDSIRRRLAEMLNISPEYVNIKAKSGESVGFIGRGEAISAEAVVLVRQRGSAEKPIPAEPVHATVPVDSQSSQNAR